MEPNDLELRPERPRRGYCLLFPQKFSNDISPPPAGEPMVESWAAGVTTAPRPVSTLERCLESLTRAGWATPRLFAEPGAEIPERFRHLPLTARDQRLGAYPNWYLALAELFMREPRAEAYLMVQDDTVFARGIREFLGRELWPDPNTGAVSLYCPSHYACDCPPGFHVANHGWRTWGAQALVFPNPSVRELLGSPFAVGHRHHGPHEGLRNVDAVVGGWCRASGRPYYVFTPSLAQHIGEASTLYANATATGWRCSTTFLGEDVDVDVVLNR